MSIKKISAAVMAAAVLAAALPAAGIIEPTVAMAQDFIAGWYNPPQHEGEYDSNGLYIENGVLMETAPDLTNIVVPDGVTKIASLAFDYTYMSLKSVTIPASMTKIAMGSFYYCSQLEIINLDPNNSEFTLVDGVLFNKDKTRLIVYPRKKAGASYTIPEGVTEIDNGAFGGCKNLVSVSVPEGVSCIGWGTFDGCTKLKNIYLPDSLIEIQCLAFGGCESLTELTVPAGVNEIDIRSTSLCTNLKTIIGYPGSYAETFAAEDGREFKAIGEADVQQYAVSISCEDEDGGELMRGTASAEIDKTTAAADDIVTVTVKEPESYDFVYFIFTDGDGLGINMGVTDKGNGKYIFTMPDHAVNVKAVFAANGTGGSSEAETHYSINTGRITNGTVAYSVNKTKVTSAKAGDTVRITAKANSGYTLNTVNVINDTEGNAIKVISSGTSRTFTMPDSSVTVRATFSKKSEESSGSGSGTASGWSDPADYEAVASAKAGGTAKIYGNDFIESDLLKAAVNKKVDLEVGADDSLYWKIETDKLPDINTALMLSLTNEGIDTEEIGRINRSAGAVDKAVMSMSTAAENLGSSASLVVKVLERPSIVTTQYANFYKTADNGELELVTVCQIDSTGYAEFPIREAATYTIVMSTETKKQGDINNDCKVDLSDVTAMLNKYVNNSNITAASEFKMDYDNDGQCGLSDIIALLNDYVSERVN